MPTLHLTKSMIDELKPGASDTVYWDDSLAGFGLKVTPRGRKVFIVLYRTKDGFSRLRKYTIGPYGQITLAIARITAQKVLAARLEGKDPAGEKRRLRQKVIRDAIEDVVADYRLRHVNAIRSASETNRILEREVLSRWKGRSIHEITRQDVLKLLDEIVDRGSPGMANRVFTVMRSLCNWAIGRGILEKSPCAGLSKPSQGRSRDRVLSDDELRLVIFAARQAGRPYGAIVELLALTGQRRNEVASMRWQELDLDKALWTIPGNRAKNGRQHVVHLSPRAIELITAQDKSRDLVFPNLLGKPFMSFPRAKQQLDQVCGVRDWVLHDLRRTVVSGMAALGIAPHVADKILNHQSGTISGIAAVYQRHEFLPERKAAIELWAIHISGLLQPKPAAVAR
jgi:integrase